MVLGAGLRLRDALQSQIDATWLKHEAAKRRDMEKREKREAEEKEEEEGNAAKLKAIKAEWFKAKDQRTGAYYYYSSKTSETQWDDPAAKYGGRID